MKSLDLLSRLISIINRKMATFLFGNHNEFITDRRPGYGKNGINK